MLTDGQRLGECPENIMPSLSIDGRGIKMNCCENIHVEPIAKKLPMTC